MRSLILPLALAAGCATESGIAFDSAGDFSDTVDGDFEQPTDIQDPGGLPPSENEDANLFLAPTQTDVYVFIVNPDRDTVTRIHVDTLDVITKNVGNRPTLVEITHDYATAVVFNQLDDSVTLLDAATLDDRVVAVRDNMNSLKLSPDGRWAVLWHDRDARRPDDPPLSDVASFNEVSIIELATGVHTPVVVGFNPKDITFTPDGLLGLAVADASLAVLRLDGDEPIPEFIPVDDPLTAPPTEEVEVAPDGRFAFLRQRATDALTIVNLDNRDVFSVPVGQDPTDLDLTADGTKAVVVSRTAHQVTTFDVADPLSPPEVLDLPGDDPFGSVLLAPDNTAILYTTAFDIGRYAVWNLANDNVRILPLAKPVEAMARTPTGNALLVSHPATDNADGSTPEQYRNEPGLSLVDLGDYRANTLRLSAPLEGFVNSNNGRQGYAILEDTPLLAILDYARLSYESIPLRSVPVHVGVLPDLDTEDGAEPYAWVSQEHPLGRISFYDPANPALETITGFELNAAIED